jgi:hypothetical protein
MTMADSNLQQIGELIDGRTLSWSPEDEAYFAYVPERNEHTRVDLVDRVVGPPLGSIELLGTADPQAWAQAFVEQFKGNVCGAERLDEGAMIAWFSNAMQAKETALQERREEASQDEPDAPDEITRLRGEARGRPHRFSTSELHELAFQIGGAAALPLLKSTGAVMPAEEVAEEVNMILADFGLPRLGKDGTSWVLDPDEVSENSLASPARARLRGWRDEDDGETEDARDDDDHDAAPIKMLQGRIAGGGHEINITINVPLA